MSETLLLTEPKREPIISLRVVVTNVPVIVNKANIPRIILIARKHTKIFTPCPLFTNWYGLHLR